MEGVFMPFLMPVLMPNVDPLTQVLLTKPAEVVQEACQVLDKHGYSVEKELKSELYYRSTLCQVVFRILHYANLIVAHAPTLQTDLQTCTHTHTCIYPTPNTHTCTYPTPPPNIHMYLSHPTPQHTRVLIPPHPPTHTRVLIPPHPLTHTHVPIPPQHTHVLIPPHTPPHTHVRTF